MNLSMKWLQEFVNLDSSVNIKDFCNAMTMSGSKVESYETEGAEIDRVVVGQIISIARHQNFDHLLICQVNVGEKNPIQIITEASNIEEGDFVPVALDKSTLPGNVKIKRSKLKICGIESCGMLCSLSALKLGVQDFPYAIEDGIFILGNDCEKMPGLDIHKAIGLNDTKVEFEITSNRPDCFSIIGLAREVAATYKKDLNIHTPQIKNIDLDQPKEELLQIKIEDLDLCSYYAGCVIKNIRIKHSPCWLRAKLRVMGIRPINNIVDITNYILLEYGQPIQAFDLREIEGKQIQIRRAKAGEKITTSDNAEIKLSENHLIIADAVKPIALAGIMGGKYSGIQDDTKDVFFESANFSSSSIRNTARTYGMRTDASALHEKGLDPNNCLPAIQRACELIELLDAGDVYGKIMIDDHRTRKSITIPLDVHWTNQFLNTNLNREAMIAILKRISCVVSEYQITIPSFRPDLEHKADIAKEIARFYGYNNIPSTPLKGSSIGKYNTKQKFTHKAVAILSALGLSEIQTYSFYSAKVFDKILLPSNSFFRTSVTISNPLGEDTSIMRTTALPSMLDVLSYNYNNRNPYLSLFELATIYLPKKDEELPEERKVLIGGFYGTETSYFTVKGIVESFFDALHIYEYDIEACTNHPSYHPGRCAFLSINGKEIGIIGEIHQQVAENYKISDRVYSFHFDLELLMQASNLDIKYKALPKYPAVTRDIALLCDDYIPVIRLQKAIARGGGSLIENIQIFDLYKGEQIDTTKKSVAFKIVLRSKEGTLTEKEVSTVMRRIVKELEQENVFLRT